MKSLNKWDWRCVLFGHVWDKIDGVWKCKRCGVKQ